MATVHEALADALATAEKHAARWEDVRHAMRRAGIDYRTISEVEDGFKEVADAINTASRDVERAIERAVAEAKAEE